MSGTLSAFGAPRLRLLFVTKLMLAAALCFALTNTARAHDFGSLKVAATIVDGRYTIDVTLFPEHLPASRRPSGVGDFVRYAQAFADGAAVTFDGSRVSPELTVLGLVGDASDQSVLPPPTLRMTGSVPVAAAAFAWSHAWPVDDYLLCVQTAGDAEPVCQWVRGGVVSDAVALDREAAPATTLGVARQYVALGFTHIVPKGLDHILFVLCLFLLSLRPREILMQVTAFTLAHSITLALAIYGIVRLPPSIVEPLIAASIAVVAVENLFAKRARAHRTGLVFAFGLLHGLGFAGVLSELGLPRSQFIPALVSFNIGVELGQLAVIGAAFLAVGAWFGRKAWYRSSITVPASLAIAGVAVYWTIERSMG